MKISILLLALLLLGVCVSVKPKEKIFEVGTSSSSLKFVDSVTTREIARFSYDLRSINIELSRIKEIKFDKDNMKIILMEDR